MSEAEPQPPGSPPGLLPGELGPDELRRARRVFVLRHHPDRGGDPGLFAEGLAGYDALLRGDVPSGELSGGRRLRVVVVRRRSGLLGLLDLIREQHRRRTAPPRVR